MSDMKCPFCKEEIISDVCCVFDKKNKDYTNGTQIYKCNKCGWFGNKELWQELIRTRKALDVAVDALKTVRRYTAINQFAPKSREAHIVAKKAVAEITALEQKD